MIQCFKFDDSFETISLDKIDRLYVLHRNKYCHVPQTKLPCDDYVSKIEFGFLSRTESSGENYMFLHESTISFIHHVIQVRIHREYLYLFGYRKDLPRTKSFEIGCLYLPSLRPIWSSEIKGVDSNCNLLVHDDHIVFIKNSQKLISIKLPSKRSAECKQCKLEFLSDDDRSRHCRSKHQNIFMQFQILKNKYLQDLGASVFKKMDTDDDVDMEVDMNSY